MEGKTYTSMVHKNTAMKLRRGKWTAAILPVMVIYGSLYIFFPTLAENIVGSSSTCCYTTLTSTQKPYQTKKDSNYISVRNCVETTPIDNSVKNILQDFNISCGLEELKDKAVQLVTSEGDEKLAQLFVQLYYKLRRVNASNSKIFSSRKVDHQRTKDVKSLAFIKGYKVGGTLISSLLSTYAYTYDLNIDPSESWSMTGKVEKRYDSCVDVSGTNHPKANFYHNVSSDYVSKYFCNDPTTFMFIRNPTERLWSAYNHYKNFKGKNSKASIEKLIASSNRTKTKEKTTHELWKFIASRNQMLTSPHMLLSSSYKEALELSQKINFFSQDESNMDASLVMLAEKAGMSLCDILYKPCKGGDNSWGATKCNEDKLPLDKVSAQELYKHSIFTKEFNFYRMAMLSFRKNAANYNFKSKLKKYLVIRKDALKACSTSASQKAWKSVFLADPYMHRKSDSRWVLKGENFHSVVPTWVCMQAYCRATLQERE